MEDDSDIDGGADSQGVGTGGSDSLPPAEILELDPVYEALGHSRRRYLCYTLLEDTKWSLTELAAKIAAWEADRPENAVGDSLVEQVYTSLYHGHVPKLVDENVIQFDETTERITAGEHAEQVLAALQGMGASLDSTQETHARGAIDEQED